MSGRIPSAESPAVGYVVQNERYPVISETDGWVEINSGYISADYVDVKLALDEAKKLDLKSMVFNMYDNLGISSVDTYLNIREEPSENATIIGKMTSKSAGDILETVDGWYKIKSGPVTGYVSSEYILTGQAARDEALQVAELMAIVSTDRLNARTEPSTDADIWTQISSNERYAVLQQLDGWVEIELDTSTAFVSTDYVDVRYALPEAVKFSELDGNASLRNRMVNYALQFVGNPYVWGGNDPAHRRGLLRFCEIYLQQCGRHLAPARIQRPGEGGNTDQFLPDAPRRPDFSTPEATGW